MKTNFVRYFITFVFGLCLAVVAAKAVDNAQQFQSDNPELALLGIWALSKTDGTIMLSVGLKNTGSTPIRAFRATLLKRNDFDEGENILALEYSSEAQYLGKGKLESDHLLQSGETIFFNLMTFTNAPDKTFYSAVPYISPILHAKSKKEVEEIERELGSDRRFILKVGKIVK